MYTKTRVAYGRHRSKFYDHYVPEALNSSNSYIILIHGGYFRPEHGLELMDPMACAYADLGYEVFNLEYPRVGEGFTSGIMLTTVFKAFDYICGEASAKKCVVIGHSAGGYYALMLALRDQVTRFSGGGAGSRVPDLVIAQAPLTDLWDGQERGLSDDGVAIKNFVDAYTNATANKQYYDLLSPSHYEVPIGRKIRIVHGYADDVVPLAQSEAFAEHSFMSDEPLHRVECGHFELIDPACKELWDLQLSLLA